MTVIDSLWLAGGWLNIPYSAGRRIDSQSWMDYIKVHCDDGAKQSAKLGCFPRCIVVVGRDRAKRSVKGFEKMLRETRKTDVHKLILRARIKSLQFTTKYFSPKLP